MSEEFYNQSNLKSKLEQIDCYIRSGDIKMYNGIYYDERHTPYNATQLLELRNNWNFISDKEPKSRKMLSPEEIIDTAFRILKSHLPGESDDVPYYLDYPV